jgi:hypothetical protein
MTLAYWQQPFPPNTGMHRFVVEIKQRFEHKTQNGIHVTFCCAETLFLSEFALLIS